MDPNYIYVLKMTGVLPGGPRYYIGKSKHVQTRLLQHQTGTSGVEYVKFQHDHGGTIVLEEQFVENHALHEDHLTELYMYKYGINYVRGGTRSHCKIVIDPMIDRFRSADDLCYMCGDGNHRSTSCPFRAVKSHRAKAQISLLSPPPKNESQYYVLLKFVICDVVCICKMFPIPLEHKETYYNTNNLHVTKNKKIYRMASAPAYWHNQNCSVTIHQTYLRDQSLGLVQSFILDLGLSSGSVKYIFNTNHCCNVLQKKSFKLAYKHIGP